MNPSLFLTGGTGVLGRRAVRDLVAAGHRVRATARNEAKATELRDAGAEPVQIDLFDADAVKRATAGCDAILHLATSIPPMRHMRRPGAWAMNVRLRTEGTAILLDAARAHGIDTFVKESIIFPYPDRGDDWINETVDVGGQGSTFADTLQGERLVDQFTAAGGRGIVLRFGSFLAPEAHHMDDYLRLARTHVAPGAGHPAKYASYVHADDAATAVVAALGAPAGIYNVVDDEPVTRREFADAFSAAFGLGHLIITPPPVVKVLGGPGSSYLLRSQRVSNAKFRAATGWAPEYPSAREALAAVAASRPDLAGTKKGLFEIGAVRHQRGCK